MPALIAVDKVTKSYPGVIANAEVSIAVEAGTVHAIVGENGAGKSTLMRILYGATRPDSGKVLLNGEHQHFGSPADAIAAGIGMVYQHFKLAENLSVLDNVIAGAEPVRRGRIDRDAAAEQLTELSARYGLAVDPRARVADLGVGVRQRVELLKALFRGARILILDEPTALLTAGEAKDLLSRVRALCADGLTVLFISHHLDEVLEISDTITVMRQGRVVATSKPGELTARDLAVLMVGSEPIALPERDRPASVEPVLQLSEVSTAEGTGVALSGLDLSVGAGEIVGVAGVEGNGQDELVETVLGLRSTTAGVIELAGADITKTPTGRRRAAGLGCVPQDRQREGLLLRLPLWRSQLLGQAHDRRFVQHTVVRRRALLQAAKDVVAASDVRTPSVEVVAAALSGGNQQKFLVGRELSGAPRLLVAAQPTRGVDVNAQRQIWSRLIDAAAEGMGILVISTDLDELAALCDRIVVVARGRITAEFDTDSISREAIGQAMGAA